MTNINYGRGPERVALWTANLMSTLRPGGMWVIPRTVSTVLVLSTDPPLAQVHSIFPDNRLAQTLLDAGWIVQMRDPVSHD